MGIVQRVVAVLLGLVFLVAVLVFASLALGVLLAVGVAVWGWLWWRSRSRIGGRTEPGGAIIEGEYRDITPSSRIRDRD